MHVLSRTICQRCGCCETDPDCGCVGRCDYGDPAEGHCVNGRARNTAPPPTTEDDHG